MVHDEKWQEIGAFESKGDLIVADPIFKMDEAARLSGCVPGVWKAAMLSASMDFSILDENAQENYPEIQSLSIALWTQSLLVVRSRDMGIPEDLHAEMEDIPEVYTEFSEEICVESASVGVFDADKYHKDDAIQMTTFPSYATFSPELSRWKKACYTVTGVPDGAGVLPCGALAMTTGDGFFRGGFHRNEQGQIDLVFVELDSVFLSSLR